jgi:hypothetical protein
MRKVRIILIVLVLVGFPALSWFYLSSGLKWRVGAQDETVRKERLGNFELMELDSTTWSPSALLGTYYLVAVPQDSIAISQLKKINTQFGVRSDFRTIYFLPAGDQPLHGSDSTWLHVHCTNGCQAFKGALFGQNASAAIVDDSLYVRGRYQLSSVGEVRKLVEHLAVVLPIEKRERIELKRGKQ